MAVALTSLSHGAGCGCKLPAADLRAIVAALPRPADPRVLDKSGQVLEVGTLAREYNFTDGNGTQPAPFRINAPAAT